MKGIVYTLILLVQLVIPGKLFSQTSNTEQSPENPLILKRVSTEERNKISKLVEGMVIYNTTDRKPQFYNGTAWKYFDVDNHYIGEEFGGGIIFYIDSTNNHGLIVSSVDQSTSMVWGTFENAVGASGKMVGMGKSNTEKITKANPKGELAANICRKLKLNGFDDWFLPSIDELKLIYQNLKLIGIGNFMNDVYWSSTETDFNNAWLMNFGSGHAVENNTSTAVRVRAVRQF